MLTRGLFEQTETERRRLTLLTGAFAKNSLASCCNERFLLSLGWRPPLLVVIMALHTALNNEPLHIGLRASFHASEAPPLAQKLFIFVLSSLLTENSVHQHRSSFQVCAFTSTHELHLRFNGSSRSHMKTGRQEWPLVTCAMILWSAADQRPTRHMAGAIRSGQLIYLCGRAK